MTTKQFQNQWKSHMIKGLVSEAIDLYWDQAHEKNQKRFNKQVETLALPRYDWLIIPAGIVLHYYVLLINAVKPKKVFFLGTHEFRNQFLGFIVKKTHLKRKDYVVNAVDYDNLDIATVYGIIKDNLKLFKGKKVLVDLTRGKRVLTAAAGVMASFNRYDIAYIDEDWVDEIKRGLPCTEKLLKVRKLCNII